MPEYPDQPVNIALLDEQLQALSLPGYEGVSRLTKRRLEDGTIEPSEPYLLSLIHI